MKTSATRVNTLLLWCTYVYSEGISSVSVSLHIFSNNCFSLSLDGQWWKSCVISYLKFTQFLDVLFSIAYSFFTLSQFILVQSTAMSNVCLHQRSPTYLYRAVIIQIRCSLTDTHLTFQIFSWLCAFYQCECVRAYLNNLSLASERDRTRSHKINTMDSLTHSHWIFIYTIQRRICV